MAREIPYIQAIGEAVHQEMARDETVIYFGQNLGLTDEDPFVHAARKKQELGFEPPLDIVDGAARILDPYLFGLNSGEHAWGKFFKDYKVSNW